MKRLGRRGSLLYEMSKGDYDQSEIPSHIKAKLFTNHSGRKPEETGQSDDDRLVGTASDAEIRELFQLLDIDNDKQVSPKDLDTMIRMMGIRVTEAELVEFFGEVKAGSDQITEEEVKNMVRNNLSHTTQAQSIKETFAAFDQGSTGYITAENLQRVLLNLGFNFTDEEIASVMENVAKMA